MFYVYLLKSKSNDEFYVGSTNDLRRRFKKHNDGKEFSTKKYLPWKLIYYEAFESEHLARMREQKLKQHGNALRELKKRLGEKTRALPSTGLGGAGLTLVELIIVIVILAVLVLIAIAYFRGQIFKGNDAKRKADIDRIKIAAEEYEKDHDCYPSPSLMSCNPGTGLKPYLEKIACDPMTHASYMYVYQDSTCPGWFKVYANLENKTDAVAVPGIGPNSAFNYVSGSPNAPGDSSSLEEPGAPPSGGGGGSGGLQSEFYGCMGGVCVPISWDSDRPGPQCDPNYQNSSCYNQCAADGMNECVPWK